jgi:DNA-binding transcriptional regulator YhcF (GntR family)
VDALSADSWPRNGAPPLKRDAAIAVVREMIANGSLKPGDRVPSGPELARKADCHVITARDALRHLVSDGTLTRGVSKTSRPRVGRPDAGRNREREELIEAPSRHLGARRRARGMTQQDLAGLLGVSITTVGHAETGRLWQSREFWQRAEAVLGGDLLRLADTAQGAMAGAAPEIPSRAAPSAPRCGQEREGNG